MCVNRVRVDARRGGYRPFVFERWRWKRKERRAGVGDPRGGLQSEQYRRADPRDVVVEGEAMSGPGGAPQEGRSVEERREQDDSGRINRLPGGSVQ